MGWLISSDIVSPTTFSTSYSGYISSWRKTILPFSSRPTRLRRRTRLMVRHSPYRESVIGLESTTLSVVEVKRGTLSNYSLPFTNSHNRFEFNGISKISKSTSCKASSNACANSEASHRQREGRFCLIYEEADFVQTPRVRSIRGTHQLWQVEGCRYRPFSQSQQVARDLEKQ